MKNYQVWIDRDTSFDVEGASYYSISDEGHLHFVDEDDEVFGTFAAHGWIAVGENDE